jgi:tetratricopeptide (TPR) repeat protein
VTRAIYRFHWFELLDALQENDARVASLTLDEMMKAARSIGVRRLADYSRYALHVARRAEKVGKTGTAGKAYDAAIQLDDSSFDAAASRASFLGRHGRLREALRAASAAFSNMVGSAESRLSLASSFALSIIVALIAAAVATVLGLFFRHARRIAHDLRETASRPFGRVAAAPIAFVLLALPVFLTFGPLWLLLYWAMLAYAYSARGERFAIGSSLLVLALAPIAIETVARENLVRRSPIYRAAVDLEERREDFSVEDDLASLAAAYPDQADAWFLLARYAERAGDNGRALLAYGRAIQADAKDYRAFVNRGNVRFLEGAYNEAISDYEEATRRAPEAAEAFYNLSVARSEIYDFKGQEQARARALQISRRDVDSWSARPPLSRVVPASYQVEDARERARLWSARTSGRPSDLGPDLLEIALSPWCLAPLGALVAAWIFGAIRTRIGVSTECSRCGRPFCRRCKRHGGPALFCAQCVRVYARKEEIGEEARQADRRETATRQRRRRDLVRLGSVVIPGLSRFFAGRPWAGIAILFAFFLAVALAVGGPWLFDLAPLAPSGASLPARLAAAALALVLWLFGMTGAWRPTRES